MPIILETSQAEVRHHAALRTLQQAEEFARLYGVGQLSQTTLMELMSLRSYRNPPLVFESTPSRQPNSIMQHWINSTRDGSLGQVMVGNVRGMRADAILYNEE